MLKKLFVTMAITIMAESVCGQTLSTADGGGLSTPGVHADEGTEVTTSKMLENITTDGEATLPNRTAQGNATRGLSHISGPTHMNMTQVNDATQMNDTVQASATTQTISTTRGSMISSKNSSIPTNVSIFATPESLTVAMATPERRTTSGSIETSTVALVTDTIQTTVEVVETIKTSVATVTTESRNLTSRVPTKMHMDTTSRTTGRQTTLGLATKVKSASTTQQMEDVATPTRAVLQVTTVTPVDTTQASVAIPIIWLIAAAGGGGGLLLLIIILVVICLCRRKRTKTHQLSMRSNTDFLWASGQNNMYKRNRDNSQGSLVPEAFDLMPITSITNENIFDVDDKKTERASSIKKGSSKRSNHVADEVLPSNDSCDDSDDVPMRSFKPIEYRESMKKTRTKTP